MKKLLLVIASCMLLFALGLRAYFLFVPPPQPTLEVELSTLIPDKLNGWAIADLDMAESPESSARISNFLNFDDALFRTFRKDDIYIGLYIAYWKPGKASYRWAGAHTPDTCWVLNGWTRLDRQYAIPLQCGDIKFKPAEFGIYEKDGNAQHVHFWHLVGGAPFGYAQKGVPNILGAILDVKAYGLKLREEQFFIRFSSNKPFDEIKDVPEVVEILSGLSKIGLETVSDGL